MKITSITGGAAAGSATVLFDAADPLFAGHFPAAPILPGVALIDAAQAVVARLAGRGLALRRVANAKFSNAVRPAEEITFTFTAAPAPGGELAVSGRWTRGAERIAEISFTASPQEAGHE